MTEVQQQQEAPADDAPDIPAVMQAEADTEAAEEAEEATLSALTLEEAEQGIDDGSRLAEGVTLSSLVERLKEKVYGVKVGFLTLTTLYKDAANEYAASLRSIIRSDNIPDWSGTTGTAVVLWQYAVDPVLASLEASETDKRKIKGNITNHVNRQYRDLHLRQHVVETTHEPPTEEGAELVPLFPNGPDDTNELFLAYCREQYVRSGVAWANIPRKYWSTEDKELHSPSPKGSTGPTNPMATMRSGTEGAKRVVARYVSRWILQQLTDFTLRLIAGAESEHGAAPGFASSEDRKQVADIMRRVSIIADYAGRFAEDPNKTDADDKAMAEACFYSADDESVFADSTN